LQLLMIAAEVAQLNPLAQSNRQVSR